MACLDENTIGALVEGMLDSAERSPVDAHLDECASCREAVAATAALRSSASARASAPGASTGPASGVSATAPAGSGARPARALHPRGHTIGRYVVLEVVGTGASGVVYAAYDPSLDRKVALKLLRAELGGSGRAAEAQSRLQREAQAMARLSHPNVVSVFDVGVIDDQVFVAMELVAGCTLTRWLRDAPRSWREIVEAFERAGRGLASAHGAGIVHRDFKPDNVLVGAGDRVLVTDFGLARMFDEEPRAAGSHPEGGDGSLTHTGAIVGTPAYMAPEQLRGEAVTARSDQFSFCVALYEALHGERPFRGATLKELADHVLRGEISPPAAGRQVPSRLRAILLRGLSSAPEQRYPTMDELLAALVADSARARRRRLAVGAAVVLSLLGGAALMKWAGGSGDGLCTGAERKLAGVWDEGRRGAARSAIEGSKEPFAATAWAEVERGLDAYAAAWTAGHKDACEASRIRGEQSDDVLSARMVCLDSRLREVKALVDLLAEQDKATAGKAVQAVSALTPVAVCSDVAALSAPVPPPRDAAKVSELDALRGRLARAKALTDAGRYAPALTEAEAAVEDARRAAYPPLLALALYQLAVVHRVKGNAPGAETAFFDSLRAAESGRDDRSAAFALGGLVWATGVMTDRRAEAHRYAALGRAVLERIGGDPELESVLAGNEGITFVQEGKFADAEGLLAKTVELRGKVFGEEHLEVAKALTNLGAVYVAQGRHADAVPPYDRALRIMGQKLGADHPSVALILNNQIEVYAALGRLDEARATAEKALAVRERAFGPEHLNTATTLQNLAEVLQRQGKSAEALERYRRVVAIYEKTLGPDDKDLADPLTAMGEIELAAGRPPEAVALLERALRLRAGGDGPYKAAATRFSLAQALWDSGKDARTRARSLAEEARTAYAAGGKPFAEEGARVEQWLRDHPLGGAH